MKLETAKLALVACTIIGMALATFWPAGRAALCGAAALATLVP